MKGENPIAVPPHSHLPLIPPDTLHLVAPLLHITITTLSPMSRSLFISNYQSAQFLTIKFGYIVIPVVSSKRPSLMPSDLNKLFGSSALLFTLRFKAQAYIFCHLTEPCGIWYIIYLRNRSKREITPQNAGIHSATVNTA